MVNVLFNLNMFNYFIIYELFFWFIVIHYKNIIYIKYVQLLYLLNYF